MVTNSKVLTVSYGTFSCTLEGFDDSFDTMKAIAEYFRDLAADDRYFGAEPPTPDAEMLARIAEREIARRVSARTEEGAIYLSANAPQPPEATPQEPQEGAPQASDRDAATEEATAPQDAPQVPAAETPPLEAEGDVADAPQDAPDEAEPEIADFSDESAEAAQEVAQDDQEAEAPVAQTEDDTVEAAQDTAQDADQGTDAASHIEDAAEVVEAEDHDQISAETVDEADEEDSDELTAYAEAEILDPEDAFEPEDDSIAAKLQRIRAVVSKSAQEPEDDDFSEDEHAESFLSETRREIESVLKLDDEMAAAAAAEDAEKDSDAIDDSPAAESAAEAAEESAQPIRARVLRMKKSDFEAAVSEGLLEAEPDDADIEASDAQPASSLSPEDEADLLAELAQVEAELNRSDAAAEAAPAQDAPPEYGPETGQDTAPVAPKRPKALVNTGEDMSRLLRETDNQMDEPEGSRRRQAIAHLRAAVAATKAEKKAGDAKPASDQTEAYREDLASVVRTEPRRVGPRDGNPSPRAAATPLKLVAEQRIDTATHEAPPAAQDTQDDTSRGPVRPRRVSAADRKEAAAKSPEMPAGAEIDDASSFAEFAESVGATRLPDVLEAAAAYLTYVEGRDKFSRPMVMRMARDVDEENFNREDTLRTFGQLLRENKIAKISGGRFTASESIAFKPEDRAAG